MSNRNIAILIVVISLLLSMYLKRRKLFKMILSKPVYPGANFTWYEVTQTNSGFPNIPNEKEKQNIKLLVKKLLQPIRDKFGAVTLSSVFRSEKVNEDIGGSSTSQHRQGLAADIIKVGNEPLRKVFEYIKNSNLPYDQLIYETGTPENKDAEWIHISFNPIGGRKQAMLAPYDYDNNKRLYKLA